MTHLVAPVFDTIAFRWLEKDFCLTIEGNNLDLDGNTDCDKVVFSDPDNTRAYQWTFQAEGTYKVTCMDMGPTDDMFEMYIYVTNSTKQLIRSVLANAFFFLILIGLCMGVALGAQWFLRAEFLGPAKDTDGVSWCYKENLYTQSTETSAWTAIRDDGLCCKYTGCEETPGANEKWKLFCGTAEEDWTAEIQAATLSVWKGKYDQVYSTGTICSQVRKLASFLRAPRATGRKPAANKRQQTNEQPASDRRTSKHTYVWPVCCSHTPVAGTRRAHVPRRGG